MKKLIFVFLLITVLWLNTFAAGTTAANFLKIPVGSRPIGMGGAFVAIADDGYAIFYNPAGPSQFAKGTLVGGILEYVADIELQYFTYGVPITEGITLGIGIETLSMDPMRTYDYDDPEGEKTYNEFTASDNMFIFNYSQKILENLSIGVSFKTLKEELELINDTTNMFDFGVMYKLGDLRLGLAVQNLGGQLKFIQEEEEVIQITRIGASYEILEPFTGSPVITAVEADLLSEEDMTLGLGVEYWFKNILAFRFGYRSGDMGNIAIGVGFKHGFKSGDIEKFSLRVDYSFYDWTDFGDVQGISLGAQF